MKYVTLTTAGPVSLVTLNRPERLNAIGLELLQDLHEALTRRRPTRRPAPSCSPARAGRSAPATT